MVNHRNIRRDDEQPTKNKYEYARNISDYEQLVTHSNAPANSAATTPKKKPRRKSREDEEEGGE